MGKNIGYMERRGGDVYERDKTINEVNQNKHVALDD